MSDETTTADSIPFKWKHYSGTIQRARYGHDQSEAWLYVDTDDGQPIATLTVCLDDPPPDGHVYIKDYSENEGVLAALIEQGMVEDTGKRVPSGWVDVPLVKVLLDPMPERETAEPDESVD